MCHAWFADTAKKNSLIIGSLSNGTEVVPRNVSGLVLNNPDKNITFPIQHVVSRGGEYFFVPSIRAIRVSFFFYLIPLVYNDVTGLYPIGWIPQLVSFSFYERLFGQIRQIVSLVLLYMFTPLQMILLFTKNRALSPC